MFAFWEFGQEKRLYLHISRQKDICFTLIFGPFAGKINSIFAAGRWVKDPVLFKFHSMNLKQGISSDCLKNVAQFVHMEQICAEKPGANVKPGLIESY